MRSLLSLMFLGLLFTGCKQYSFQNLPAERLRFGNKGGITGGAREYVLLLDNGQLLFDDEYSGKLERVGKFSKKELLAVKTDLARLSFTKNDNSPGNYNTSLQYHHEGRVDRLSWSRPGGAPSPAVKACYDTLLSAVRRLRKAE
ncbi:MAG: hypothetical protein AAGF89_06915 [Bacteroidota bacterium]